MESIISRRELLGDIAGGSAALVMRLFKQREPQKPLKQKPLKLEPYIISWSLEDSEQSLKNISFDPNDYRGKDITKIVKDSFFVSNKVVDKAGNEISDVVEGLTLFDRKNEKAFYLPGFQEEIKKRGYDGKIHFTPMKLGTNGVCLYKLCRDDGEILAVVVADVNSEKAYSFFQGKWDFQNFWLSKDGKTGRATTKQKVVFYNTNTIEMIDQGYGKIEAISGDGNVTIYKNDYTDSEGNVLSPRYFIYDETPIDFNSSFILLPGDVMKYKLSERGGSFIQISYWNNGKIGLSVFIKTDSGYERSDWLENVPLNLGLLDIKEDGIVNVNYGTRKVSVSPIFR